MPAGKLQTEPDHAALLQRVARAAYGSSARSVWVPSDEADVFILHGNSGRIVVKIERPDLWVVRREAVAFPALRTAGFDEFPAVELTNEELDDGADWLPFMVMPFTEHRPWHDIWRDDPANARWVTERIGSFLRRLSIVDSATVPGAVLKGDGVAWFENWFEPLRDGAEAAVASLSERCIAHMTGVPDGFGGWQFAQVLTDGRNTFTAIDWGNLGRAWPMADLAGAVFGLAHFADEAVDPLCDLLIDVYTDGAGLGDREPSFWLWTATWWLLFAASAARRSDPAEAQRLGLYALAAASRA